MAAIISIITPLEIQFKGRKFDGIQLITFHTILLFFPWLFDLDTVPILLAILLIKLLTKQQYPKELTLSNWKEFLIKLYLRTNENHQDEPKFYQSTFHQNFQREH